MKISQKTITIILMVLYCFTLCACQGTKVPGSYPPPMKRKVTYTAGGGAIGAVVGKAVCKLCVGSTAAAGGFLGFLYGSYKDSRAGIFKDLNEAGVTTVQVGDTLEIILPADIFFPVAEDEIRYESLPVLNRVVELLKLYGGNTIYVSGNTDDIGNIYNQQALTERQAQSIASYLWAHGIPMRQIVVNGCSDRHDIASNRTVRGSYFNRNVMIWVREHPDFHNQCLAHWRDVG